MAKGKISIDWKNVMVTGATVFVFSYASMYAFNNVPKWIATGKAKMNPSKPAGEPVTE